MNTPSYSDKSVKTGAKYRYAVSAVDLLANESERSQAGGDHPSLIFGKMVLSVVWCSRCTHLRPGSGGVVRFAAS